MNDVENFSPSTLDEVKRLFKEVKIKVLRMSWDTETKIKFVDNLDDLMLQFIEKTAFQRGYNLSSKIYEPVEQEKKFNEDKTSINIIDLPTNCIKVMSGEKFLYELDPKNILLAFTKIGDPTATFYIAKSKHYIQLLIPNYITSTGTLNGYTSTDCIFPEALEALVYVFQNENH